MDTQKYLIGSGYFHQPDDSRWAEWFFHLWRGTNLKNARAERVVLLANGGCKPPVDDALEYIHLDGNLGHVHQLIGKQAPAKPHAYCGWSGSILTLAMIAYCGELDFVYMEQDALLFGDCIGRMYEELGNRKMIFGRSKMMPCAQSLFLIRHEWIPTFVRYYLSSPDDRFINNLPERKFASLLRIKDDVCQFSFGYDRDRPFDSSDAVWYGQKFTAEELRSLDSTGRLVLPPNMPDVKCFTNDTTDHPSIAG